MKRLRIPHPGRRYAHRPDVPEAIVQEVIRPVEPMWVDPNEITNGEQDVLAMAFGARQELQAQVAARPDLAGVLDGILRVNAELGRDALLDIAARQQQERSSR